MALESGSFIDDLVDTNPLGTDAKNKGDDHLRLIKKVVKATFPGLGGAAWRVQAKSSAYTVVAGDNMTTFNCTAALTLSLTAVATLGNKFLSIVIANGGDVTIDPNSSETVNGSATQVIPDGAVGILVCNGTLWFMGVMPVNVTAAALTVLDDTTVAAMVTTLGFTITAAQAAALDVAQIFTKIQRYTKGGDIASASPLVLDTDGNYFDVTGTTGFSQITCTAGDFFMLQFDGALTMTDGANLDLGGGNITTAAGDRGLFYAIATNTAQLIGWIQEGAARALGRFEFVSTAAIGLATTLTVTGLTAGYDYIFVLEAFAPTDDAEVLWMRWSDDNGVSYEAGAGDYQWANTRGATSETSAADTEIQLSGTGTWGNDAGNTSTMSVTLVNPNASSEQTTAFWEGYFLNVSATPVLIDLRGAARFTQGTDAVDAVQFLWSGGSTFKAQGDITVWRRKRS